MPAAVDVVENHSSTDAVVDAFTRWSGSVTPATVPGNFAAVESVNGPVTPSVHARVDQLLDHHAERLDATASAVAAGADTAYQVAQRLAWTRRRRRFTELDVFNQCMAVIETSAHLDLLAEQGRLHRTEQDDVRHYTP